MFDLYVTFKLGKTLGIPLLRLVDVSSNSYPAYIEQMNPIPQNWHRMLIYHTAWICGPQEVNFRKVVVGHFPMTFKVILNSFKL